MRRREQQRQRVMNGRQTQFPVPCAAQGDKVKKSQEKLSPARQEGWGEAVLRFVFISYCYGKINTLRQKLPFRIIT